MRGVMSRLSLWFIGVIALIVMNSAVLLAAEPNCPWLVREISPVPDVVAGLATFRSDRSRTFSVTYFRTDNNARAFYGFGMAAERGASVLASLPKLANSNAQGLECLTVEDDGAEQAYCALDRNDDSSWTLYLVASADKIAELERIQTRIEPVQLDVRGASDFSGRLPRQLVPVSAASGQHELSAASFQICAFPLH